RKVGVALMLKGEYPVALGVLTDALPLVAGQDEVEAVRIRLRLGDVYSRMGNYANAKDLLSRAVEAATTLEAHELVAEGSKIPGSVCTFTGDLEGAAQAYRRCLPLYE